MLRRWVTVALTFCCGIPQPRLRMATVAETDALALSDRIQNAKRSTASVVNSFAAERTSR